MSSFSGTYSYTVDVKGRINFKKFLKRLSSEERLNPNYHLMRQSFASAGGKKKYSFFYIFTENSWNKFWDEKVEGKMKTDERLVFLSNLCGESSLDGSERLSLPKEFLEFIKAKKDLVLQGDGNRIQVWSKEEYDKYFSKIGKPDESMLDMFS